MSHDPRRAPLLRPGMRIICLGDSITADDQGYVTIAREAWALRELGLTVINAGSGGDTARQMQQRFERHVLSRRPDWVTIMAGTADTIKLLLGDPDASEAEGFAAAVDEMISQTLAADARVALCTPTPLEPFGHGEGIWREANAILASRSDWLHRRASEGGMPLALTGEALTTARDEAEARGQTVRLTTDGVHLGDTARGLTALAFMGVFD